MSKMGAKLKAAVPKSASSTKNVFKTLIFAQLAAAGPPLGPLLGQHGLNIGNFCKTFNEKTKNIKKGIPLPVTVRIKPDRSYDIQIHTPPVGYYLKQAAGIERGKFVFEHHTIAAGKITLKHVYEIAKIKYDDPYSTFQVLEFPDVVKQITRMAIAAGIQVVKNLDPKEYEEFLVKRKAYLDRYAEKMEELRQAKLQRS